MIMKTDSGLRKDLAEIMQRCMQKHFDNLLKIIFMSLNTCCPPVYGRIDLHFIYGMELH